MRPAGRPAPQLTVVVPAYRAVATIGGCLGALRAQAGAPPFEVVVVDSSPDDDTARAVERANQPGREAPLDLLLVRSPERLFPGSARNRGVERARAPWLLFLDADCVAAPDLVACATRLTASGVRAAGGSIALAGSRAISARLRHLLEFKESLPGVPARATWMLPSACLLVERASFLAQGGFPDTRASEDWLFDWRLWRSGADMRFEPALRVAHLTAPGWRAAARYLRLLGVASAQARRAGGLPGQSLVRRPALCLLLPFGRTARAILWCARYAPRELAFLALAWPGYFALAAVWAAGFYAGLRPLATAPPAPAKVAAQDSRSNTRSREDV